MALKINSILESILIFFIICFSAFSGKAQCLIIGADLSYVNSIETDGGVFKDSAGNIIDPYMFFAQQGANMVRVRLWHTPENNIDYCGSPISTNNLNDVILAFQRAKAQGLQLNLAIHYGDYFNDPGKQKMPEAWEGLSHQFLLDSIRNYTFYVLAKLNNEGVTPDIVAIGNETTWGFVDETATTDGWLWPNDADKFNVALNVVDSFNLTYNTSIKKALHFTEITAEWLAGLFESQNISNFDIIGLSFYPSISSINNLQELGNLIKNLKINYNKDVMIFETGAPWTTGNSDNYSNIMNNYGNLNYPVSKLGQKNYLFDLARTVYQNGGTGVLYWEPDWISSEMCDLWGKGSSYENASFFDFNNGNLALPAFELFNFCNSLSLNEVSESEKISIFPNPTTKTLKIKGLKEFVEIQIINNLGQIVMHINTQNDVEISKLPAGIYHLSIILTNQIITKPIVIN